MKERFSPTEIYEKNFIGKIRNRARNATKVLAFIMMTTFGPSALMAKERIEKPSETEKITVTHKETKKEGPLSVFYVEGKTREGSRAANLRVIHQGNPKVRGDEFMCEGRFSDGDGQRSSFEMFCQGNIENLLSFRNKIDRISIPPGFSAGSKDRAMERERIRWGVAHLAELDLLRNGAELIKKGDWTRKIVDENIKRAREKFEKKYPGISLNL